MDEITIGVGGLEPEELVFVDGGKVRVDSMVSIRVLAYKSVDLGDSEANEVESGEDLEPRKSKPVSNNVVDKTRSVTQSMCQTGQLFIAGSMLGDHVRR